MRRLLDVLREDLGLTGTKEGCGEGECGACTVLLDGEAVARCLVPMCQVDGAGVRTVEGLAARDRRLGDPPAGVPRGGRRPVRDLHAGHADGRRGIPGSGREPTDDAIRDAIAGNLCRCTGYTKIIDSIGSAARRAGHGIPGPGRWDGLMPVEPPVVSPELAP